MSEKGTHHLLSTLSNSSPMLAAREVDQASQTPDPQTGESGIRLDWRLLEGSPGSIHLCITNIDSHKCPLNCPSWEMPSLATATPAYSALLPIPPGDTARDCIKALIMPYQSSLLTCPEDGIEVWFSSVFLLRTQGHGGHSLNVCKMVNEYVLDLHQPPYRYRRPISTTPDFFHLSTPFCCPIEFVTVCKLNYFFPLPLQTHECRKYIYFPTIVFPASIKMAQISQALSKHF